MTPAELHAAVHAAVTARLELARAATPHGPEWHRRYEAVISKAFENLETDTVVQRGDVDAILCWAADDYAELNGWLDPTATIRACEADLERLDAHSPMGCGCCNAIDCPANPQVHPRARCDAGHDVMWPRCYEVENIGRVYAVAVEE